MDGVKDGLKGDERGHLVASTISGPSDDKVEHGSAASECQPEAHKGEQSGSMGRV